MLTFEDETVQSEKPREWNASDTQMQTASRPGLAASRVTGMKNTGTEVAGEGSHYAPRGIASVAYRLKINELSIARRMLTN